MGRAASCVGLTFTKLKYTLLIYKNVSFFWVNTNKFEDLRTLKYSPLANIQSVPHFEQSSEF
jgi:hypothetical protein